MAHLPPTNVDMLAWFTEDETDVCESCREHACVTLPDAQASFCLACGAVTVDKVRGDSGLRLAS